MCVLYPVALVSNLLKLANPNGLPTDQMHLIKSSMCTNQVGGREKHCRATGVEHGQWRDGPNDFRVGFETSYQLCSGPWR